jgi:hypothetical protein
LGLSQHQAQRLAAAVLQLADDVKAQPLIERSVALAAK